MTSAQRIVLNTVATFGRTVFNVGLALFSSRWILMGLGQGDFGIYSVVGSLIIFLAFLNAVMAGSASRHFAFAIGQGDMEEVKRWFNSAVSIHLCMATGLVLTGWPMGEYIITHWLTIPIERISAALWVFRISLISAFVGMVAVPFVAMFTARQRIAELAVFGVVQAVMSFSLAWWLITAPGDRLLVFAVGMTAIPTIMYILQIYRAHSLFHECCMNRCYWFDVKRLREIFSFATWNLIGSLGALLRNQGTAILLNMYFGPTVNAAYGIANQVSTQSNNFAAAMLGAFTPEITSSEGRGDRARMISLSLRVCKMSTLLVLLFTIPLMVEMDYVLAIWLTEAPEHTALFCRFILSTFLIDRITSGYMVAVNAHGQVAAYQMTLGGSLVMTLPLAWFFLAQGYAPTSAGFSFVITMTICSIGRLLWVRKLFGVQVCRWVTEAFVPCLLVGFAACIGALLPIFKMSESFVRLIASTSISLIFAAVSTWIIALDNTERRFVLQNIDLLKYKMKGFFLL